VVFALAVATTAGLFTAASYLSLTGFDYLGMRYAGARLAYRRAALASFTGLSIGHTLGLAPLIVPQSVAGSLPAATSAAHTLAPVAVAVEQQLSIWAAA